MTKGKAISIFMDIKSDKYTVDEKGQAIFEVLDMNTHMSITKDKMLDVIRFLFDICFDVEVKNNDK